MPGFTVDTVIGVIETETDQPLKKAADMDDVSPLRYASGYEFVTGPSYKLHEGYDVRFWRCQPMPIKYPTIINLLLEKQCVYDPENPELITIDRLGYMDLVKAILKIRLRYGWKPVVHATYLEPWKLPVAGIDLSLTSHPPTQKNCWYFRHDIGDEFQYLLINRINDHAQLRRWHETEKTHFCNFIYSNPKRHRRDFCKLLARYKPILCPGKELNNMPRLPGYFNRKGISAKLDFLAKFRFTIAIESFSHDYYISEKIYHPFCVGSIPIYWGSPQVTKYYNPEAFVNCHDYESFEEVVTRVIEIDSDPELYRRYLNAPPILPSSRLHRLREETRRHAETVISTVLDRRKEKCSAVKGILRQVSMIYNCLVALLLHLVKRSINNCKKKFKQDML